LTSAVVPKSADGSLFWRGAEHRTPLDLAKCGTPHFAGGAGIVAAIIE